MKDEVIYGEVYMEGLEQCDARKENKAGCMIYRLVLVADRITA
jgi:hypothetical protein